MFLTRHRRGFAMVVTGESPRSTFPTATAASWPRRAQRHRRAGAFVHLRLADVVQPPNRRGHRRCLRAQPDPVRGRLDGRAQRMWSRPTSRPRSRSTSTAGASSPVSCSPTRGAPRRTDPDVRRRRRDRRPQRRAHGHGRPHRRAVVPPRRRFRRRGRRACRAPRRRRRVPRRRRGAGAAHAGTLDDELALLVVHGVLHVLGHDHAAADDAAAMRVRELALLQRHHWRGAVHPGSARA